MQIERLFPGPLLASLVGALGCGPGVVASDGGADGSSSGTASSTTATSGPSTSTSDGIDETGAPDPSAGFIESPDGGAGGSECSIFAQDCPPGLKCTPFADDGGSAWNGWGCFPIVDDPAGPGEPCTMEGSPSSGIDTCQLGSMCFHVDSDTLEGTCLQMCSGDWVEPYCDDPQTTCRIHAEGYLVLCMPMCHPLEDDCAEGQGCYPSDIPPFTCAPDASGESGAAGDACEFINHCDPGTVCIDAGAVPECAGSVGCCSSVCTVGDDSACLPPQVCQPWFPPGDAPIGFEDVGVCALP